MKIHLFKKLHYNSFICIAVDTKKYRYWYNLGLPFYLTVFPAEQLVDRFLTDDEKVKFEKAERYYGTKKVNISKYIEAVCHTIIHLYFVWFNKNHDEYWAKLDPGKYGAYVKWYKKIFSKKYFRQHQSQMSRVVD